MNRSLVQMEYFGYLRRNPNKLNAAGGNYMTSDMVKAFITSGE